MCGILAIVKKDNRELDLPACRRALSCLTLRGPDLSSYKVWDNRVFLGQTILSITGNIKNSDGHLCSATGQFQLLVNGEIYNYYDLKARWLDDKLTLDSYSGTDTEVLVNLHEVLPSDKIPPLLDGMYAYTLLDKKEKTLSICRDVQGEKSLYVYEDSGIVIISSEISPILTLVPFLKPDPKILRDYFHTRHFMFLERTLYPGIRQLLPGNYETINLSTMQWTRKSSQKLSNLIDPQKMEENEQRSIEDLTDELDSLMRSCLKQMIPQERKYAAVVSGGVDSSLISYYLLQFGNPDELVAVNHKGKDRISMDLSGFEKVLGRNINILNIDAFTYSSEIMRCQRVCRSPLFAHSFIGQSLQSAFIRSTGCPVLFGGDGADEILGGYSCYVENRKQNGRFSPSPYSAFHPAGLDFVNNDTKELEEELASVWVNSLKAYEHIENQEQRLVQAMMYCDTTWQLASVGLRGADLMSSMWNIETRSVFVRRPIIEFALNLPIKAKSDKSARGNILLREKPLLKKLFLRYFPSELLVEKQGFAGFPNESASYIGEIGDFLALDVLGVNRQNLGNKNLDRDTAWKLVNIEYFLRGVA